MPRSSRADSATSSRDEARPLVGQRGHEIQPFGSITRIPIGLGEKVCKASVTALNQLLAHTMTLRDLKDLRGSELLKTGAPFQRL